MIKKNSDAFDRIIEVVATRPEDSPIYTNGVDLVKVADFVEAHPLIADYAIEFIMRENQANEAKKKTTGLPPNIAERINSTVIALAVWSEALMKELAEKEPNK